MKTKTTVTIELSRDDLQSAVYDYVMKNGVKLEFGWEHIRYLDSRKTPITISHVEIKKIVSSQDTAKAQTVSEACEKEM